MVCYLTPIYSGSRKLGTDDLKTLYTPSVNSLGMRDLAEGCNLVSKEDDGIFVGEKPKTSTWNQNKMEQRVIEERAFNWIDGDGHLKGTDSFSGALTNLWYTRVGGLLTTAYFEADGFGTFMPFRNAKLCGLIHFTVNSELINFFVAVPDPTNMIGSRCNFVHDLQNPRDLTDDTLPILRDLIGVRNSLAPRLELIMELLSIDFQHHYLFSLEHVIAAELKECFRGYEALMEENIVEFLSDQISGLRITLTSLQVSTCSREKRGLSFVSNTKHGLTIQQLANCQWLRRMSL